MLLSRSFRPHTLSIKERILRRITDWPTGKFTPISKVRPSDCDRWLSRHAAGLGASSRNDHVWMIKDVFAFAVRDRLLVTSPAAHLKASKREDPVRLTPTPEQFAAIVANVRALNGHHGPGNSADFLEILGLAGLGQAEASALTAGDAHWDSNQISVLRRKTSKRYHIPIFPQLRQLLVRLWTGKAHHEKLFAIQDAKKALAGACRRLGYPAFSQRSLRRMFITQAIERGVDVKVIAEWQGHRDGGVLILKTYSHVRREHSNRMAQLMSSPVHGGDR